MIPEHWLSKFSNICYAFVTTPAILSWSPIVMACKTSEKFLSGSCKVYFSISSSAWALFYQFFFEKSFQAVESPKISIKGYASLSDFASKGSNSSEGCFTPPPVAPGNVESS